jgi:hypothetical protein
MKLYKDGNEILVDKDQLPVMLDGGWSMSKEEVLDSPEEIEEVVEEVEVKPLKIKPKRKPRKITKE